jgi:hypothetical protein
LASIKLWVATRQIHRKAALVKGALASPSRAKQPSQGFSFLGSLNTFGTSGLLLEADIRQSGVHGRFGPGATFCTAEKQPAFSPWEPREAGHRLAGCGLLSFAMIQRA